MSINLNWGVSSMQHRFATLVFFGTLAALAMLNIGICRAQQASSAAQGSGNPLPVRDNGCVVGSGNSPEWGVCHNKAFSPTDYGAVGDGNLRTIGTSYGSTLAAVANYISARGQPYSFVTAAAYGLMFPLTTSESQGAPGAVLTFLTTLSGIGGWSAPVPQFNGLPAAAGNFVQPSMTVSGSCIVGGTTVAYASETLPLYSSQRSAGTVLNFASTAGLAVSEPVSGSGIPPNDTIASLTPTSVTLATPTTAAVSIIGAHRLTPIQFGGPAGTITLSRNTSTACAGGTLITFAISSAQLQGLSADWLGAEAAIAAAYSGLQGGKVSFAGGKFLMGNRPLLNPGINNLNAYTPSVDIVGAANYSTELVWNSDTAPGVCAMGEANRGIGSISRVRVSGLRLLGPGIANTAGLPVANMEGLCVGAKERIDHIYASQFHSGVNILEDHGALETVHVSNNFYGYYFGPGGDTLGNWSISNSEAVGEAWAALGVAWNSGLESSTLVNLDLGGNSPYAFYREVLPAGQTMVPNTFLANNTISNVNAEQVGEGYIFGENAGDAVTENTFINDTPTLSRNFQIAGRSALAVIDVGQFTINVSYDTDFSDSAGNFGLVRDAIVEASNNVQSNDFGFVPIEILNAPPNKPILKAGTVLFNTFTMDRARGEFRTAEAAVTAGQVLAFGLYAYDGGARPMAAGFVPLGVAAQTIGSGMVVPVIKRGLVPAAKDTTVGLVQGSAVCVSTTIATDVTACFNAAGSPLVGTVADNGNVSAAGTSVSVDVNPSAAPIQPAIATPSKPGVVQPDGISVSVNGAGVLSAAAEARGVLGSVSYNPASNATYTNSGYNITTTADVDPADLQVSFVAPSTGSVLIIESAVVKSGSSLNVFWSVGAASSAGGASGSDVPGSLGYVTAATVYTPVTHVAKIAGLTRGQTYYMNWRWSSNSATPSTVPQIVAGQQSGDPWGAATMFVLGD
jgi:hypothetical protein